MQVLKKYSKKRERNKVNVFLIKGFKGGGGQNLGIMTCPLKKLTFFNPLPNISEIKKLKKALNEIRIRTYIK